MRVADNHVSTVLELYQRELAPLHGEREAMAIASVVFRERLGWDRGQLLQHGADQLSESELLKVYLPLKRLRSGEPLQYVLGSVNFHGIDLLVDGRVLIPRPETEELVEAIVVSRSGRAPGRMLDIGTGSGCIALALKQAFPLATVLAVDVSDAALALASDNGRRTGLDVEWQRSDILDRTLWPSMGEFDLVVSNPPYVPRHDQQQMSVTVLQHEPHTALFVPDNDPLLFYRAMGEFGLAHLTMNGELWAEVHHRWGVDVPDLLTELGYRHAESLKDLSGNTRFVHAVR